MVLCALVVSFSTYWIAASRVCDAAKASLLAASGARIFSASPSRLVPAKYSARAIL